MHPWVWLGVGRVVACRYFPLRSVSVVIETVFFAVQNPHQALLKRGQMFKSVRTPKPRDCVELPIKEIPLRHSRSFFLPHNFTIVERILLSCASSPASSLFTAGVY